MKAEVEKLENNKLANVPTSLNYLKTKVDDLDVGKLKNILVDLKKLNDVVDNEFVKNKKILHVENNSKYLKKENSWCKLAVNFKCQATFSVYKRSQALFYSHVECRWLTLVPAMQNWKKIGDFKEIFLEIFFIHWRLWKSNETKFKI